MSTKVYLLEFNNILTLTLESICKTQHDGLIQVPDHPLCPHKLKMLTVVCQILSCKHIFYFFLLHPPGALLATINV